MLIKYKYKFLLFAYCVIMLVILATPKCCFAQKTDSSAMSWGDQSNGNYKNPVLAADYSDPDVIRVGHMFYMVCSDFHFMGMPVLSSKDLVNWKIIGQVYRRLDISDKYNTMERYGGGSWAPSIRYYHHKYYVYFCTPDEGLFMSTAVNPGGPWSPLTQVKHISGWEDPCPFWDEDGNAYLGHSVLGAGPIIIHRMNKEGTRLLDSGITVYRGPTSEGTKIYKRNKFYYIIIPEGGVSNGYETALRSKSIYGPYERKVVLEQGKTAINGPHQGGLVELQSGQSWFIHFQSAGILGRICHLEPVVWRSDWPLIGIDQDGNGVGEPVSIWKKPDVGKIFRLTAPQTSDEFNQRKLGIQWQWNHNPVDSCWSVERPEGCLSLKALKAEDLYHARNTITQKLMGFQGVITTLLRIKDIQDGQEAGLCLFGSKDQEIGISKMNGVIVLYVNNNGKITYGNEVENNVYLRAVFNVKKAVYVFMYSLDGKEYKCLGNNCVLSDFNYWKGVRPGLFSYNRLRNGGTAEFDWFHYRYDGPLGKLYANATCIGD